MEHQVIETSYPLSFREEDAKELGKHLKARHSVVLVGMKRVGISNFLRFFLNHKDIVPTYIEKNKNHLFVTVDLNDLVEREIFPFWTLILKRIEDAVMKSSLTEEIKKEIEDLFLSSIQSQDLFLTIDSVRKAILKLVENSILPTLFFIRFDRLKDAVTSGFFDNLQGLRNASSEKLAYVFTSFRGLGKLAPSVFTPAALSVFAHDMYMEPATKEDTRIVYQTYRDQYKLSLSPEIEHALFDTVDGYFQYLQYALICLYEGKKAGNKTELFDLLTKDERIVLQSEELWESLEKDEQLVLLKIHQGQKISREEGEKAKYLLDTGFIHEEKGVRAIFSSLFDYYLNQQEKVSTQAGSLQEFSKKENALFVMLKENLNEVCEREKIVESVWPEAEAFGVTDWAIDRLVARVRNKLKLQKNNYEIQTIKTRGYKLVDNTISS